MAAKRGKASAGDGVKTVILCGGMGTRMREETEFLPKPMVAIGNRPILWHIMKLYSSAGFDDFVLALGYKGDVIKRYFYHYEMLNNDFTVELGNGGKRFASHGSSAEGWRVTLADTGEKTLKGGRVKRIEKYVEGDDFMLTYGDGLADIDTSELLRFHRKHGRIGTVTGVNPVSRFGEMKVSGDGVTAFKEKPKQPKNLVNGGFFVFRREIFDYLDDAESCDLEAGPLERLAEEGELMAYRLKGDWGCMDTYRDVLYFNELWQTKKAFWKRWRD